jgi:DNA-binding NarL/FixJ family response regulator
MTDPRTGAIRVLVVDDQRVVGEGLSMLLGLIEGLEVVGAARRRRGGPRHGRGHRPGRRADGPERASARRDGGDPPPVPQPPAPVRGGAHHLHRRPAGLLGVAPDASPRSIEAGSEDRAAPDGLTRREVDVVRHIAAGHSNAEIAAALFVSEATVKTHVNQVFAKTGVRDRAQLVGYAFRTGLAAPHPG